MTIGNDDAYKTRVGERLGLVKDGGLQIRRWETNECTRRRCILCGGWEEKDLVAITLFDGWEELGNLCQECVDAGPRGAADRTREEAAHLRGHATALDELAEVISHLEVARWRIETTHWKPETEPSP